ncbi:MAG: hypothetical protein M1829_006032 [Trizodia sp. TS-e1964]|nr:MAG: hypothetical protein M1829_006032 [Trizodia sp. TS-e1964]
MPSRTSVSSGQPGALPTYQPPSHTLTPAALRQISQLSDGHRLGKLKKHIRSANEQLTGIAGDLNDRVYLAQDSHQRRKAKRAQNFLNDDAEEEERDQAISKIREDAAKINSEMETATRLLIDDDERVNALEAALKDLNREYQNGTNRNPTQTQRGRRRSLGDGDDEDDDEDSGADPAAEEQSYAGPASKLQEILDRHKETYDSQPKRIKYANHNNYKGYKRIIHDALNPGEDAPPLPNANTWFPDEASDEVPTATSRGGKANEAAPDDSDDDLEIAGERISTKCPITLLPFVDPLTSSKCPHSFEKTAILEMIAQSSVRVGGGTKRGTGEKAIKCPICDEASMLRASDLYSDKLLLRKVKRQQARDKKQEGESSRSFHRPEEDSGEDIDVIDDDAQP